MTKYDYLVEYIHRHIGPCAVAVSGGTDSTLLLRVAADALEGKLLALTVVTPYTISREHAESRAWAESLGVRHIVLTLPIIDAVRFNPEERCYVCKRAIMSVMCQRAMDEGFPILIEGTNADDMFRDRPGMKALKELGIRSPLRDCSVTKEEVRQWLKMRGHPSAERQSNSCLLTRLPHGTEVKTGDLVQIETAENYLLDLGARFVRVRKHGCHAVVELDPENRAMFFRNDGYARIVEKMEELGFVEVTIDEENRRTQ
jgi:uncharacterized protein